MQKSLHTLFMESTLEHFSIFSLHCTPRNPRAKLRSTLHAPFRGRALFRSASLFRGRAMWYRTCRPPRQQAGPFPLSGGVQSVTEPLSGIFTLRTPLARLFAWPSPPRGRAVGWATAFKIYVERLIRYAGLSGACDALRDFP